jgi:hypothetical protein
LILSFLRSFVKGWRKILFDEIVDIGGGDFVRWIENAIAEFEGELVKFVFGIRWRQFRERDVGVRIIAGEEMRLDGIEN